ncbi:MAG: hypothetical protein K0R34_401 [Herbinix sp.]|jgi:hypothetical protein|nr:hypothetical protein [Herbinix sp.]
MQLKMKRVTVSGVITVYLALILLLILSLVFTVIEGARVSTAKVYTERALSTAMDSVWAEYYEPLWKEYHIFGYSAGEGSVADKAARMEERLTGYLTYTLQPNSGEYGGYKGEGTDLYDINLSSLSVMDQTRLMDCNGELIIKEAVDYMKYHELADGLSVLLEKLSLLETPKKVSAVYDKKLVAETELAKADKNILRLMELLDGVKTSKKGIKLDQDGKLIATEYFTKMLCFAPLTMGAVGINHEAVFETVKNRYVNPSEVFSRINSDLEQLLSIREQLSKVKEKIISVLAALNSVSSERQSLNSNDKSENARQQLKALNQEATYLEEQLKGLHIREQELLELKKKLTTSASEALRWMNHTLQELIPITEDAEQEAGQVTQNATSAAYLIDDFEESLYEEGENLGEEIYASLEKKLEEMKQYSSSYEEEESFNEMYETLGINRTILEVGQKATLQALEYLKREDYAAALNNTTSALIELQSYNISNLTIDYSSLVIDKTKPQDPIEEIGKLIQSGITGLIVAPDSISKKELTVEQLPSTEAALTKETIDFNAAIANFFKDALGGGEENEAGNLLYDFRDTTELSEGMGKGINRITEHLIYQEYLKEHFEGYPVGDTVESSGKPTALNYELEYLLVGNSTDRENLASVITRIVFLRMILNFVTLLGDKARCEEALLAATAIVGFTGLPMLINITQAMLLMVWSFAESLVDTCALLLGKEVPIFKQKIGLQFPEMFLLNRDFLKTKAEAYTATSQLSFDYIDYLRVFLLIKQKKDLACRSMDLIQENLNLRYEERIFLRDCLFGYEALADCTMNTKFITIPFLRNYINHNIIGYQFSYKAAYSY